MENASIFCLSEVERNKGGLIRKKSPEEIVFISEICYPIWCAPWGKITLLFDGLSLRKHTISFDTLPNIDVFMKEVHINGEDNKAYLDLLKHNIDYFQNFSGKRKKVIQSLISNPSFLKDFESYISKAKRIDGVISDKVILTTFIDKEAVRSSVNLLSDLIKDLDKDLDKINKTVKILIRLTDKHIKKFLKKNDAIRLQSEKKIVHFRSKTFKKTEWLRKSYDKKIFKIQKTAEKKIKKLKEKIEILKRQKIPLIEYKEKFNSNIPNNESINTDRQSDVNLQKSIKRIGEIDREILAVETSIASIENSLNIEVSKINDEFKAKKEEFGSNLKKIEKSRDSKIKLNEERIESLKDLTSSFINKINKLSDLRKAAISDFDNLGLSQKRRKYVLFYLPFFLICYKQEFKRRYTLFSPCFAHGMRGVTRIKGVFKVSKIHVILNDRSESLKKFLTLFLQLLKQNPIFEEKLVRAGAKTNILGTKKSRKKLIKGLNQLKGEGWLSERDHNYFIEQIS
jgi:hypothetical protein